MEGEKETVMMVMPAATKEGEELVMGVIPQEMEEREGLAVLMLAGEKEGN